MFIVKNKATASVKMTLLHSQMHPVPFYVSKVCLSIYSPLEKNKILVSINKIKMIENSNCYHNKNMEAGLQSKFHLEIKKIQVSFT